MGGSSLPQASPDYLISMHFIRISRVATKVIIYIYLWILPLPIMWVVTLKENIQFKAGSIGPIIDRANTEAEK